MYKRKLEKKISCPLDYGLDIFDGKWKSKIICILGANGTMRYTEIRKGLTNITDAVLASMLKEMLEAEIIDRKYYNEIPPKVEYSLTEKGESAWQILKSICQWSKKYIKTPEEKTIPFCKRIWKNVQLK